MNEELYKALYDKLLKEEDYKTKVYDDGLGNLTVGLGHKLVKGELAKYLEGAEVPESELQNFARKDIERAYKAAKNQAGEMNVDSEDFIADLVSVNFQLGDSWEGKFPKAYGALKEGRYDDAIKEINNNSKGKASAWLTQTPGRVKNFENGINRLKNSMETIDDLEPSQEETLLRDHKRALSYDYGINNRDTPQGFNIFVVAKSFGLPFNMRQQERVEQNNKKEED